MGPLHECSAQSEQERHCRGAAQGKPGQTNKQAQGRAENLGRAAVGAGRHGVKHQCGKTQLCQCRRSFMGQLSQPEAGNQRQHAGIGHGPCIVHGTGFTAEGKGDGLGLRAAGQVINGVPGCQQRKHQQQAERNTHGKSRVQEGQALDGNGAQPVRRQCIKPVGLAQQLGCEPVARIGGQLAYDTERGDVFILPGGAPEKTGQHVGQAKQQQGQPRKAADGRLGNDGWRRLVQNGVMIRKSGNSSRGA
ncbi:hypothetical protein D9M73_50510 [compost metagenome]